MIVEKWAEDKTPFQLIWEHMDGGYLELESAVPQGALDYAPDQDGRMVLHIA